MNRSRIILTLIAATVAIGVWLWLSPPRWWLNYMKPVDLTDPVAAGEFVIAEYGCRECHLIGKEGHQLKAPNLNGVTDRLDSVSLRLWLRDPRSIRWKTLMPNFDLSDPEIEAISSYLYTLNHPSD